MWNINHYFRDDFWTVSKNPINHNCKWTQNIGMVDGISAVSVETACKTYSGPFPSVCSSSVQS